MKHLVLRCSDKNRKSHDGFQWPESGPVEAPDWEPTGKCGAGLHGWLCGEGDASSSAYTDDPEAVWQVVEVDEYIDLGGKVKFPRGNVIFSGSREAAVSIILERYPCSVCIGASKTGKDTSKVFVGDLGTAKAGNEGTATAGYLGTATAGKSGTATAGDKGTATAGDKGTASAGREGTATAGDVGTATAGYRGTATAGHLGTATAGYLGIAKAGRRGTATAGDKGTAKAGNGGTAMAGRRGTAMAGDNGTATAGSRGTATAGYRGTATAGFKGTAKAGDSGTAKAGECGIAEVGNQGTATVGEQGFIILVTKEGEKRTYKEIKPWIPYLNKNGIPVPLERWEEDDMDEEES